MNNPDSPDKLPTLLEGHTEVTRRILQLLDDESVSYQVMEHHPVFTSAEAAEVRLTTPEQGAKALIVKAGEQYHMLVLPGDRKADNNKVRRLIGSRHLRFADRNELYGLTGCIPGAVPPFGNLFGLDVWIDELLSQCEELAFNAGSHTVSLKMRAADLIRLTGAKTASFSRDSGT